MTTTRSPKAALFIVWLVVFIDLLGFGIVLPVMPRLAGPYLEALGWTTEAHPAARGAVIGVLFSAFSLMQFVFSPVWGRISDRIGRRPVLLVSLLGSVVFYALFGYAVLPIGPKEDPSAIPQSTAWLALGLMLVARVGAGIAGASVGTAAAVIADCTTQETRAKGMSLIGIAFGAGFTLGPLIAYFGLAVFDSQRWAVGAFASGISAVALLLAVVLFRETRDPANRAGKDFFSVRRSVEVLKMPTVGPLILVYFLAIFGFANFEVTLSLFTQAAFRMTEEDNFLVFAAVGAILTVAGGVYRPLVKRRGEFYMLVLGVGLLICGFGGLGAVAYASSQLSQGMALALLRMFYFSSALAVIGFAFVNPSVSALVSRRADQARQGEVLGVNQSFAALARILGPLVGSLVFELHRSHVLPFVVGGLAMFAVVALLPVVNRPPTAETPA